MSQTFRIGRVAKETGLSIDAIRFYQRMGLIKELGRTAGGYRLFTPEHIVALRFIERARHMGFSLEQTKKLLLLRQKRVTPSFRIRNLLATTLFEIRQKIQTLEEAEKELQRILRKR